MTIKESDRKSQQSKKQSKAGDGCQAQRTKLKSQKRIKGKSTMSTKASSKYQAQHTIKIQGAAYMFDSNQGDSSYDIKQTYPAANKVEKAPPTKSSVVLVLNKIRRINPSQTRAQNQIKIKKPLLSLTQDTLSSNKIAAQHQ